MKIKDLDPKSIRFIEAGCISGRKDPLTKNQSGELVFSHEQNAIEDIKKIGSVELVYYEISKYSYDYLIFRGSIVTQHNRQIFVNSIILLRNLRKLGLYGNFPTINNPRLESPPLFVRSVLSDRSENRAEVACRGEFAEFNEYRMLFKDSSLDVLKSIAINPNATRFPEFEELFKIPNQGIKLALARNPNATKFEEFKNFFNEENYQMMHALAKNPKAVEFKEFLKLFTAPYFSVRTSVLSNPKISKFPETFSLIPWYLRKKIYEEKAIKPEMLKYPEFDLLFKDPNPDIRLTLACSRIAADHPDYELFFSDPAEEIRAAVAGTFLNPQKFYKHFLKLANDDSFLVRLCLFKNIEYLELPNLIEYLDSLHLSRFIHEPNLALQDVSRLGIYVFSHKLELRMHKLIEIFASNPRCVSSRDYRQLFVFDLNGDFGFNNFLHFVAQNPNAPIHQEYRNLFNYLDYRFFVAMNPNATIFPEFNSLFEKRHLYINLAKNLNAPFYRKYQKFFDIIDLNLMNAILQNRNAQLVYDLSLITQRKTFLERLANIDEKFAAFISNPRVSSRFIGDKIDLRVSKKDLEKFHHYLLQNPQILHYLTPNSVKKLLNIGLFRLLLDKEPAMILDIFLQMHLGRSEFLHQISSFIDKNNTKKPIKDLRFIIQSNIARLLPKYETIEGQCLGEMKYFKNFDNKVLKIKNFIDLVKYSSLSFEKVYRLLLWNSYTRFKPYLYIEIPKKSGGVRNISIPVADLKQLQTAIKENILDYVEPHSCVYSFQKNKSPTDNARYHISNNRIIVIKIDLKDFFPNINIHHVYRLFTNLGYDHDFSLILAHLCTDKKWVSWGKKTFKTNHSYYLPQGAPTSPQISNLIFSDVDLEFEQFSRSNNLKYSRYADDLIFSTENLNADVASIIRSLLEILKNHRFVFNKEKIQVLRPGVRQSITGIVVNNGIHAKKEVINRIRGLLHILKNKLSDIHPDYQKKKQQLNGLIAYLNTIEPEKAVKYWAEFQKLK